MMKEGQSPTSSNTKSDPPNPSITNDNNNNNNNSKQKKEKKRRAICDKCHRPAPRACICASLPTSKLELKNTTVIVLQHPHEVKQKQQNRSIPVLELCLSPQQLHLCVGRRLGELIDPNIMKLLQPPNLPILLYPQDNSKTNYDNNNNDTTQEQTVVNLTTAMKVFQEKQQQQQQGEDKGRIVVLALDATWKFAREMNQANIRHNQYPPHLLRVGLDEEDFPDPQHRDEQDGQHSTANNIFDAIRTTPASKTSNKALLSDDQYYYETKSWMCTAECIARVLSRLEDNPDIHEIVSKPLRSMVQQWNSFMTENKWKKQNQHSKKQQQKTQQDDKGEEQLTANKKQKT